MEKTEIKKTAQFVAEFLNEKKAEDVDIIDISEKSAMADYFINATGGSERQVASLVEDVEDKLAENDILPKNIEGKNGKGWILMDYGDFIINIFSEEMRESYSLEKIWGDCEITTIED